MRFSWTGLILAPLLAPLAFSAAMVAAFDGNRPLMFFLVLMVPGCVVSYGTMVVAFLPSLYLLSAWRPLTGARVCLLGAALGAAAYVPLTWLAWKSSGPDSGPPEESYFVFLVRWAADPLAAVYPVAGLVTAALYWWLGTLRHRRSVLDAP